MSEDVESVRNAVARAAADPRLWPEALWRVGRLVGSDMTLVEHVDRATGAVEIAYTDRPDIVAAVRRPFEQHYWRVNLRWEAAQRLPPGAIHHDDLVGDERTLDGSEFYVDLLKPLGLRYFIGSTVAEDCERIAIFSLQRSPARGRVGATELAAYAAILPQLRNALAIHLRTAGMPSGQPLAAALDRLADPIAIVGDEGRLLFANRAMAGLVEAGDVFRLCGRRLAGADEGMDRALRSVACDGFKPGAGLGTARCGRVTLRAVRLGSDQESEFGRGSGPLLCLIVDDPRRPRWARVQHLMRELGLTRCEAAIGAQLAEGLGIDAIAARLGVSRNTVRTHLSHLREKLGVRTALGVAAEIRRAAGPFA